MLEMLVGAAILLAGFLAGRVTRQKTVEQQKEISSDPKPICSGCTHHRSFHPKSGACVAIVPANAGKCQCRHAKSFHLGGSGGCWHVDSGGFHDCGCKKFYPDESGESGGPCTCREYHGPEPLPQFYAPSLE